MMPEWLTHFLLRCLIFKGGKQLKKTKEGSERLLILFIIYLTRYDESVVPPGHEVLTTCDLGTL